MVTAMDQLSRGVPQEQVAILCSTNPEMLEHRLRTSWSHRWEMVDRVMRPKYWEARDRRIRYQAFRAWVAMVRAAEKPIDPEYVAATRAYYAEKLETRAFIQ